VPLAQTEKIVAMGMERGLFLRVDEHLWNVALLTVSVRSMIFAVEAIFDCPGETVRSAAAAMSGGRCRKAHGPASSDCSLASLNRRMLRVARKDKFRAKTHRHG
jgi:hypothetical protein